jgi:uncharacterized FAD-dependent dehydrogenase
MLKPPFLSRASFVRRNDVSKLPDEIALEFGLDEELSEANLRARVARVLSVPEAELPALTLRKRSIDARRGAVRFHVLIELGANAPSDFGAPHPREVAQARVAIVGGGPAGLFCAYQLARQGIGSIVLDRGKPVQPRRHDLKGLNRLGEGGAGTYSDGKLYTRAHKRGSVRDVIEILARHGAPDAILTDARPHIGSNRLPQVVSSMRHELEQAGVQFRFGARVSGLRVRGSSSERQVTGVELANGDVLDASHVVLATGHSAFDVYEWLHALGVTLEAKSFAMGVRIEHPQPLINRIQYGAAATHPNLPAAPYRLAETIDGRGVFSFCMCPGGFIVPASTQPDGLVVNGMSLSRRSSHYANSGLVVGVEPEDANRAGFSGVFAGHSLQRALEQAAFAAGGGMLRAPATRASDFFAGRGSSSLPSSSYLPGLTPSDLREVLEVSGSGLYERLRGALRAFDRRMRGYLTEEAVLVGVESRTSSPLRILRDPESLQAPGLAGLYPAGEGAGYAGGIMSAAMDGVRIASLIARDPALPAS